jgi:hypothetical protein
MRYPSRSVPIGFFGIATSPTTHLRAFLFFVLVISIAGLGMDFLMEGPIKQAAVQIFSPSVERAWGFTAEWRELDGRRFLLVTSVAPGGPFDRAGIKTGEALLRYGCIGSETGVHGQLFAAGESTTLRVVRNPTQWQEDREHPEPVIVRRN